LLLSVRREESGISPERGRAWERERDPNGVGQKCRARDRATLSVTARSSARTVSERVFLHRGNGVGDFNGSSSRDKNRVWSAYRVRRTKVEWRDRVPRLKKIGAQVAECAGILPRPRCEINWLQKVQWESQENCE